MIKTTLCCLGVAAVLTVGIAATISARPEVSKITIRCDGPVPADHIVSIVVENGEPVGYRNAMGLRVQLPAGCWPLTAGPVIRENG